MRKHILAFFALVWILAAADLAGTYKGSWSGGASGDFKLTLTADGDSYKAEISFTMGGAEVPTKVKSVKVDGESLTIVYQYDLQGTQLQSAITGTLKAKTLEGSYHATSVADGSAVDDGTWRATLQ